MKLKKAMEKHMVYCDETRKMSPHTLKSYANAVKRFVKWSYTECRKEDVDSITKGDILEYLRDLSNSYAPASAMQHFTIIHVFFNFLEDYSYIEESPFRRIHERKLKVPKRIATTLTIEEVQNVMAAAYLAKPQVMYGVADGEDLLHDRDCLILEFLFNTGMRVHELCSLELDAYDVNTGIVRFIGKGNKERKCYITAENVPDLYRRYIRLRKIFLKNKGMFTKNIFVNRFGGPLSEQGVRDVVRKYTRLAGISKHVTPHVFRHSFATLLMEQGVNLRYIQEYMGHETLATTQRYLHISDQEARTILLEHHPRRKMSPEAYMEDENEE